MLVIPEATASSITYWMIGLSTRGSISLGCALVAGRKRVPRPAAGKTAFRIFFMTAGNAITRVPRALPGRATLNGHARPQVRGGEPRARGTRRLRQRRGAAGGRAKALRVRAQGPLGPRSRAGDPRLRAGGQGLGGAVRGSLRPRGARRA